MLLLRGRNLLLLWLVASSTWWCCHAKQMAPSHEKASNHNDGNSEKGRSSSMGQQPMKRHKWLPGFLMKRRKQTKQKEKEEPVIPAPLFPFFPKFLQKEHIPGVSMAVLLFSLLAGASSVIVTLWLLWRKDDRRKYHANRHAIEKTRISQVDASEQTVSQSDMSQEDNQSSYGNVIDGNVHAVTFDQANTSLTAMDESDGSIQTQEKLVALPNSSFPVDQGDDDDDVKAQPRETQSNISSHDEYQEDNLDEDPQLQKLVEDILDETQSTDMEERPDITVVSAVVDLTTIKTNPKDEVGAAEKQLSSSRTLADKRTKAISNAEIEGGDDHEDQELRDLLADLVDEEEKEGARSVGNNYRDGNFENPDGIKDLSPSQNKDDDTPSPGSQQETMIGITAASNSTHKAEKLDEPELQTRPGKSSQDAKLRETKLDESLSSKSRKEVQHNQTPAKASSDSSATKTATSRVRERYRRAIAQQTQPSPPSATEALSTLSWSTSLVETIDSIAAQVSIVTTKLDTPEKQKTPDSTEASTSELGGDNAILQVGRQMWSRVRAGASDAAVSSSPEQQQRRSVSDQLRAAEKPSAKRPQLSDVERARLFAASVLEESDEYEKKRMGGNKAGQWFRNNPWLSSSSG